MADTLRDLARCCAGDDRPDCPILAELGPADDASCQTAASSQSSASATPSSR
jgi:MerR family gold-responsive transcriptional activator of gol and ges genes